MQWYEITVILPLSLLESAYNFLWLYVNGIAVEKKEKDFLLRAYIFSSYPHDLLKRLNNFLKIQAKTLSAIYLTPSANPANTYLNNEFIIVPTPTFHIPDFGIPVFIRRGRAFGIGSHPCTIYCLQAIKEVLPVALQGHRTEKILDAGTGTGVLAIAAAKLGSRDITAVEISLESVKEAQENISLNNLTGGIRLLHSSVTDIEGEFDIILANLYGPLLIKIASSLLQHLSAGGWIILGGMAVPHDDVVIATFMQYGLKVYKRYLDDEWGVAVLQKI
jgi:ribosomal protein L11 methylase PrmA